MEVTDYFNNLIYCVNLTNHHPEEMSMNCSWIMHDHEMVQFMKLKINQPFINKDKWIVHGHEMAQVISMTEHTCYVVFLLYHSNNPYLNTLLHKCTTYVLILFLIKQIKFINNKKELNLYSQWTFRTVTFHINFLFMNNTLLLYDEYVSGIQIWNICICSR